MMNNKLVSRLLKIAKKLTADTDDKQNGKVLVGIYESVIVEMDKIKNGIDSINKSLDKSDYKNVLKLCNQLMKKETIHAQEVLVSIREQLKDMAKTYQSKTVE